ncbi:MAG: phosphatidylserine decarboxylase family protein [Deltaproteobacteria bacterium]|nr:phosphatidylserine decarboxylase family protein [Deltaproteobacteria bacterium]
MSEESLLHSGQSGRPKQRGVPIAREGYPFIVGSAILTALVAVFGLYGLALFFLGLTAFVCFFFRDPERFIPDQEGAVVSPADGKILVMERVKESEFASEETLKISIFMSVFNVHVNRIPESGHVADVVYRPGKFVSANLDKASKDNERNAVSLTLTGGQKLIVVQIAGLIARRIVCNIRKGDPLSRGERFGLIRFGSRLDVYLPPDTKPAVGVGDKVLAGTSILGYLP